MNKDPESIYIKNAAYIMTMDSNSSVLEGASILIRGNQIERIGQVEDGTYDKVIEAAGKLVLPGLINTHHHFSQALLRGQPDIQNQPLDKWIAAVSGLTCAMDAEMIYHAALTNMAELIKYGCTTTTDMMYIFPKGRGDFLGATVEAARDIGMRFHPFRGSISLSRKDGALFPDGVVETSDAIFEETQKSIAKYHDVKPMAMTRIGAAPCAIFSNSELDYQNAAATSEEYGINIQTHACESLSEVDYSLAKFSRRPIKYLQDLGWLGLKTSFTHCIEVDQDDIARLAQSGSSVAHCPISNARAPSGETGIAPISNILKAGINVAIGVDGSAGNDSSNVREELRWARAMQGARRGSTYLSAFEVLKMATTGGARLLNWPEIGSLGPGKAADIAVFALDALEQAGSWDPLTAFVSTQTTPAEYVIINGRLVVENGNFRTVDESEIVRNTRLSLGKLRESFRS